MENKQDYSATIYTTGEFFGSVNKYEGKIIDFGVRPYAQYTEAPFFKYIPKGKRKPRGCIKGDYNPYLVILKGYNHPDPQSMFNDPRYTEGLVIKESRYTSFDERYKTDFDAVLNKYLELNPGLILMDYRGTQKTKIINK